MCICLRSKFLSHVCTWHESALRNRPLIEKEAPHTWKERRNIFFSVVAFLVFDSGDSRRYYLVIASAVVD